MTSRYFVNPDPEDYDEEPVNLESEKGWIHSIIQVYVEEILKHTSAPGKHNSPDVYVGDAGIAFMFLRLDDCKLYPPAADRKYLEHAQHYINRALGHPKASHYPGALLCGAAGINAVAVAVSLRKNDQSEAKRHLARFETGFLASCANSCDEMLVGRAGYIEACNYLNEISPTPIFENDFRLSSLADTLINSGAEYPRKTNFPLMYAYHGTEYLGAAHGIAGILHALLQMWYGEKGQKGVDVPREHLELVWGTIDALIAYQDSNGNFSTDTTASRGKRLVHWCHGAPGILPLLVKVYRVSNEPRYLQSARLIADLIWRKGLLRKGPGICHGVAGNGYSFLIMFRQTGETKYWHRALEFARFIVNKQFISDAREPDNPFSLYEGFAGAICFLCDLMEPERAAFPFMSVV